jgi:phage terminase large subunit-like protein
MLMEATGGLASKSEGFVIYLSTQSDEPPTGVFKAKLDYFRDVRDGKIDDPRSLGVLYEYPKAMLDAEAYLNPATFYVTNPNLGRSVTLEWLTDQFTKNRSGEALRTFLAKHANVEIGMNLRANRWPGAAHWPGAVDRELAAVDHMEALDLLLERCEVAVPGLDGGGLDDLFGFTVLGREPQEIDVEVTVNGQRMVRKMKRWLAWHHAWCHRGVLDLRQKIAPRLLELHDKGWLTIIDQPLEDVAGIIEIIRTIKDRKLLGGVAVDPAGLGEMVDALGDIGVTQEAQLLFGAPQGYAMMNAIKTAERRVANGLLKHDGSPLMNWCVGNLKIEPTATAIRATKQNAGDDKIDPVMALFDAVTVMSRNPVAKREPAYQMMIVA